MITTVTLGAISLKCDNVSKPKGRKSILIEIPGRDADIIQDMGSRSKVINLSGIISGADKDTDKTALEGYEGTNQTYNDGVDNITVFVDNVNIPTTGGLPNHYVFDIKVIHYSQT